MEVTNITCHNIQEHVASLELIHGRKRHNYFFSLHSHLLLLFAL